MLAAIDRKIAGQQIVTHEEVESPASGQVIDLMEALRASLNKRGGTAAGKAVSKPAAGEVAATATKERKGIKRAAPAELAAAEYAPRVARARARK